MTYRGIDLTGVPTLPDPLVNRLRLGYEPTDEQEELAEATIREAGLEIRRRAGASLEDLREVRQ